MKLNDITGAIVDHRVGLLINFGAVLLKDDIHRIANDAPDLSS